MKEPKPVPFNLFPEPKNTKPRTRVRVFKERHTPNPEHHNYNREQNFNQKLSSTLAWLKLQCDGAASNLNSCTVALNKLPRATVDKLPEEDKNRVRLLLGNIQRIKVELQSLSEAAAYTNLHKTKLTNEQMGIPNKK